MGVVDDSRDTIGAVDGPSRDQLVGLLVESATAAADELSSFVREPATEHLRRMITSELEQRIALDVGIYLRADHNPARRRGIWRFSLLIEAPDRVLAAIEVSGAPDDIEYEAMALARLTAGVERGVAERGFLISASHAGRGLAASTGRAKPGQDRSSTLPFTRLFQWQRTPWQLVVIEADQEAK